MLPLEEYRAENIWEYQAKLHQSNVNSPHVVYDYIDSKCTKNRLKLKCSRRHMIQLN